MAEGLTGDLCLATLATGLICLWITSRDLPLLIALAVSAIKVSIPCLYFAWLFDGTWTFYDDRSYQLVGANLLARGYNPFTILFTHDGLYRLFDLAGGMHILYMWWNHLAEYLLGAHYYAAIFLNIALTCLSGHYLYRISRLAGFPRNYSVGLLLFFLLHWDILSWSSLTNLKEFLVLNLLIAALYHLLRVVVVPTNRRTRWAHLAWFAVNLFALFWIRFYVPLLLGMAFVVWLLIKHKSSRKPLLVAIIAMSILCILPGQIEMAGSVSLIADPGALAYNEFRFLVMPQPWALQPEYSFLFLPAMLHWLFLLPALVGGVYLWRHSPALTLILIYFVLATSVYAISDYLMTSRERVYLTFVWAWLQFHGVYLAAQLLARLRAPEPEFPALLPPASAGS